LLYSKRSEIFAEFKELLPLFNNETVMINMINSLNQGLLHVGNSTEQIITSLNAMITMIREVDSSGYVVDSWLKATHAYFKQNRKDVDSAFLSYLLKELTRNSGPLSCLTSSPQNRSPFALDYYDFKRNKEWRPDPTYIKSFINPEVRTGNPTNLLISHLSSKSALSELYQKQVARRLLKCHSLIEVEGIITEVEMIKRTCGEDFIGSLNIMINDVVESKSKILIGSTIQSTVISHRYWPDDFQEKNIIHPEFVQENLESISESYSISQNNDRRIVRRPHLDEVKVLLHFLDGTEAEFTCPSEAAILISSFDYPVDTEEEFDMKILKLITGIPDEKTINSALIFWLKCRVILPSKKNKYNFLFAKEFSPSASECVDVHLTLFEEPTSNFLDDDLDNGTAGLDADFSIYETTHWPVISNMFKTFGQISAERIHSTLKMYSKEYKEPLDSLVKFLQYRVKEGTLRSSGNKIILYAPVNK
jgi:hypothetical protein